MEIKKLPRQKPRIPELTSPAPEPPFNPTVTPTPDTPTPEALPDDAVKPLQEESDALTEALREVIQRGVDNRRNIAKLKR